MTRTWWIGIFAATAVASSASADDKQAPPMISTEVDREVSAAERQLVDAAEAMPAEKYDFTPEALKIPGSDFKGVRTFALQVKHVGASNYFIWSAVTGDKVPDDIKDGDGPANLKTKADIVAFLKRSFALGHKAAVTLTAQNMLASLGEGKSTRLIRTQFGVRHAFDHYGQMVEYLRLNGIVPPQSRQKKE
ncbi:MAG TPA: DinB family protein [Myxococcaceae bacterium]|nr:DinB family protein [Myxococcaceae bacterium]